MVAVQAFEQAWALAPRPAIIFSMAQALRRQYFVDRKQENLDRAINPKNPCYVLDRKVDTYDTFTFGSVKAGDAVKIDVLDDPRVSQALGDKQTSIGIYLPHAQAVRLLRELLRERDHWTFE